MTPDTTNGRDGMMFVDGNNFFNGMQAYRKRSGNESYRYDFTKLREVLLDGYYPIRAYWFDSWHPEEGRPSDFFKAMECNGYRVIDTPLRQRDSGYEEKGVDIQLATELLAQGSQGGFDTAFVVSGDADYRRAVEHVQDLGKEVVVASWKARLAEGMKQQADRHIILDEIATAIEQ